MTSVLLLGGILRKAGTAASFRSHNRRFCDYWGVRSAASSPYELSILTSLPVEWLSKKIKSRVEGFQILERDNPGRTFLSRTSVFFLLYVSKG
jgi:hypothetical protein